ncbi:MAG: NADH-quinone oxidoreductase subunit N [Candidatus Lindowbacteria bacterium]|nr:NADH-quinone oxidoreductase subunit N [Candidatus Lindowbacteria bacterium]
MTFGMQDMLMIGPEITLIITASILLLLRPSRTITGIIAVLGLFIALDLGMLQWWRPGEYFFGTYHVGRTQAILKVMVCAATTLSIFAIDSDNKIKMHHPETVGLVLLTASGAFLLVSANHLAIAYIAFEMLSISSYALVGSIKGDSKSTEGGLKYAVFGGAASAFLLYGFSIMYGLTGSLSFDAVPAALDTNPGVIAALFVFVGVMYKLAAAPFHYWCPDAFEAGPVSVVGFLSVVPKLGGFGLLFTLSDYFQGSEVFHNLLAATAFLSMTFGNLAAMAQTNVKRLLAYSSIAHAGYILVAASLMSGRGDAAVLFYLLVYMFMNIGAFYVTGLATEKGELSEFVGLSSRNGFLALCMAVFLFSLTGLPPFGGFVGKFFIVSEALVAKSYWLIVALIVNTAISLYYYCRILKAIYLEEGTTEPSVSTTLFNEVVLAFMFASILVLGLYFERAAMYIQIAAQG